LVLSDYNPVEQTLLVRASKFHKSRLVALSVDAATEMAKYLRARRRLPHPPDAPLLTADVAGRRPYAGPAIMRALQGLMRNAGIRTASGRAPRIHDVRHTYAVHALLRWYHQGADVQAKLPALAAAMGHVSIVSTAYYLAMLPR
jgi:integrase